MSDEDDDGVEFISPENRLKIKVAGSAEAAPGMIPEDAIRQADEFIEKMCEECPKFINQAVDRLVETWGQMKDMEPSAERQELADHVFSQAHEVKDIGGMCGYVLVSEFGESLRDYIRETELSLDAQRVIVQAHVDVMKIAAKELIKDDGGPLAKELKESLKEAIARYH
jgi:chemotaxis protein histidine kinase CheA